MSDEGAVDLVLLVFRVVIGAVFLAHGVNHVWRGGKIPGTARWFESLGMRPGVLHAWTASITEIAVALLLFVGLLTPLAGAGAIGVMLVAWVTNHRGNGFFIFRPGEGWEYVMVLTFCGLLLAVVGPGRWSLDDALDLFQPVPGVAGLLIAVLAGGGGAAALMAACWRPVKTGA